MAEDRRSLGPQDDPLASRGVRNRRQRLQVRARLEYVQGAEDHSQRTHGRGLTAEELHLVLRRYRGEA